MNPTKKRRVFKLGGLALVAIGAVLVLLGLSGGGPVVRIGGPAIGFVGVVILAQAKGRD